MARGETRRRVLVALAALALVGVAASCSSDEKEPEIDPATFVQSLMTTMEEEGSAHIDMSIDAGPESMSAEGDMVFGDDGRSDARLRSRFDDLAFTTVIVDDRLWVSYDDLTRGKYFEVDVRNGSFTEREFALAVDLLGPINSIEPIADAVKSVEVRGEPRSFRGAITRRHRVVVDTGRIRGMPELEALPPDEVPPYFIYDMFVDDDGLLRRVEFELGGVSMRADFSRFGTIDRVKPPHPNLITTVNPFDGLDAVI